MKKLSYLMSMACIALFASCSSDTDEFVAENQSAKSELLTVGASLPGADATRLEFQDELLKDLRWSTYDQIYAETAEYGRSTWRLKEGVEGNGDNTTEAVFEGTVVPSEHGMGMEPDPNAKPVVVDPSTMITFVRYGWHDDFGGKIYKYNAQRQKAPNVKEDPSIGGIGHWIILKSAPIKYSDLKTNKAVLAMKPANSILKINIKNLPDVVKDGEDLFIKYYNNFVEGSEQEPNATVELKSKITPNEDNFIYMAFDPANDLTAKNNIAFEIQNGTKLVTAYAKSNEGVNYEPGKIYTVTLNYGNADGLTWEIPAAPVYEKVFDDIKGWTFQGNTDASYWYHNAYFWDAANSAYLPTASVYANTANDTYLVTNTPIDLDPTSNYVNFTNGFEGFTAEDKPGEYAQFVVREVLTSGYGEWTMIDNYEYSIENGKLANSGKIRINGFDGKKVQIGFKFNANAKGFAMWHIRDIVITKE